MGTVFFHDRLRSRRQQLWHRASASRRCASFGVYYTKDDVGLRNNQQMTALQANQHLYPIDLLHLQHRASLWLALHIEVSSHADNSVPITFLLAILVLMAVYRSVLLSGVSMLTTNENLALELTLPRFFLVAHHPLTG